MKARLELKIVPRASRSEFAGRHGDRLRLRIAAAPEGGKANAALIAFLSDRLGVPKRAIAIVSGATSTLKTVEIAGADPREIASKLP